MDILHDEPINSFLVVTVDAGSLDQLQFDLLDGLGVIFGVEVDGECVDHLGTADCGIPRGGWKRGVEDGEVSKYSTQQSKSSKRVGKGGGGGGDHTASSMPAVI